MKTRASLGVVMWLGAVCLAVFGLVSACNSTPAPAPAAPVPSPKMGMNVNYSPEIGQVVAETEIAAWNHTTESPDAATSVSEIALTVIGPGTFPIAIASCTFTPAASLTASNTAFATLFLYKRTAYLPDTSTVQTVIGSMSTVLGQVDAGADGGASGSWTAWIAVPFTMAAGVYLSPGDILTVAEYKTGAGVIVPQGKITCFTTIN